MTTTVDHTVTVTATPIVAPERTKTSSPTEPSDEPTSGDTTAAPQPVPVPADIPLTLDKFFSPYESWEENRYDVAGREDVQGIAAEITYCDATEEQSLELRLANKYKTLKFSVGQADLSESSAETLTVEVVGNGTQIEIRKVPFNQIQSFELSIAGVNALNVYFYLDSESPACVERTYETVIAVLESVVVSN